jgi:DNA-binding LacI/PurR family transcriptional regulator
VSSGDRWRRPTSADVAREAGLSRATVSYVLNDTPHQKIPEETRQRVLEAASRLGYTPSPAARALRSGRSDVILCLLPDWPIGPAVGAFLEHLSAELAEAGLTLVAHPRVRSGRPVADLWRTIAPAAVLALEEFDADDVAAMRATGIKVTVALRDARSEGELVLPEQRVGRLQAESLSARGHRTIGYGFPDDTRVLGFATVVCTVPLDPTRAGEAVTRWRSRGVTGVAAYNDEVALAVLAGLRTLDLRAPTDLAVIGVDDIPAAALADPPLSTVTVEQRAQAHYVARRVVARLAGTPAPRRPPADVIRLIDRDSA